MCWACIRLGEKRQILVGKPEGNSPLGKPRCRWEDNIKMDLKDMGWGVDWIYLFKVRDQWWVVVNTVMNFRVL
jgi:hypothetical protein